MKGPQHIFPALIVVAAASHTSAASVEEPRIQHQPQHERLQQQQSSSSSSVPQLLQCTPELVQDFDFTFDGRIGQVEFIHLLEDLAPSTCDVVNLWQTTTTLQSSLQEISCLCTDFGGDANCCSDSAAQVTFAAPGVYDEAYDYAVCERIEDVIRTVCFGDNSDDNNEVEEAQQHLRVAGALPSIPQTLHLPLTSNLRLPSNTTTTTLPTSNETTTTDSVVALLAIATILTGCVTLLFRVMSSSASSDTALVHKRHQELLNQQKECFDASMEITSASTPYVQIV